MISVLTKAGLIFEVQAGDKTLADPYRLVVKNWKIRNFDDKLNNMIN